MMVAAVSLLLVVVLVLLAGEAISPFPRVEAAAEAPTYQFPKFRWKKKGAKSKRVTRAMKQCEYLCDELKGVRGELEMFECIRMCVSPSCYETLYAHDPYEQGEVDVRLNSFKGCALPEYQTTERIDEITQQVHTLSQQQHRPDPAPSQFDEPQREEF